MRLVPVILCCLLTTSCARAAATPPYNTAIDVKELMAHVMDPGSKDFWTGWGEVYTPGKMVDISPKTEAEWKVVEDGAATVIAATNVMMLPAYQREPVDKWNGYAKAVADVAQAGKEKAELMDKAAMLEIGGQLDQACEGCHMAFIPNQPKP